MHRVISFVALLSAIVGCGHGRRLDVRPTEVSESEFAHVGRALAPHYRVLRPAGSGAYPTVVLVSGCSGFAHPRAPQHYDRIAERLRGRGRAVIFADYVAARGVPDACRGVMSPEEVGRYVLAAVAYARTLSFVDPSDLDVIGWSLGGGGVLAALATLPRPSQPPMRVAIALYPDCSGLAPWSAAVRTLVILAGRDAVQPPERCEGIITLVRTRALLTVLRYTDAHHGFDMEGLPVQLVPGLPALAYDAASAAAAWGAIDQILGPAPPE